MFALALQNSRQQVQWRVASREATLVGSGGEVPEWELALQGASMAARSVTIRLTDGKFHVMLQGCQQMGDVRVPPEGLEFTLPRTRAPQLEIDGTRFAIVGEEQTRPLERLGRMESGETLGPAGSSFMGPAPGTLVEWFDAVTRMNKLVASSESFFGEACRQLLEAVRLDGVMVLFREFDDPGRWQVAGSALDSPELGMHCPFALLEQMVASPQTRFHGRPRSGEAACTGALDEIVSPLTNSEGDVLGVVYGYRSSRGRNRRRGLRHLEARLFDILAQALGGAMERASQEAELARQRANLERCFAPAVLRRMRNDSDPLRAAEREVSILMADLWGFTSLCQQLSTDGSYQLLNQVMDAWTECVMRHEGTLIDYYGDGLAAMWNAPTDQADHARRAVAAAREMMEGLPHLSRQWKGRLSEPLRLGIGIHSGIAKVGNIGTRCRLKYGPRGLAVNLASRLEGATRLVGVPLLMSRSTARQVEGEVPTYRVCKAQVRNITRAVDLYVPVREPLNPVVRMGIESYRQALALYELGNYDAARVALSDCPAGTEVPREFLWQQIVRAQEGQPGRRRGDKQEHVTGPAISLVGRD